MLSASSPCRALLRTKASCLEVQLAGGLGEPEADAVVVLMGKVEEGMFDLARDLRRID